MLLPHHTATDVLIWGLVLHLAVDWLTQNEWIAVNKVRLSHPAGYVHAGLHTLALLLLFPWYFALAIGVLHLLIDTRVPLTWWRKTLKQTAIDPSAGVMQNIIASQVAIWNDQVLHIVVIAAAALLWKGA